MMPATSQNTITGAALLMLNQAEAHILVRSKRACPPLVSYSPRQPATTITGEAIN